MEARLQLLMDHPLAARFAALSSLEKVALIGVLYVSYLAIEIFYNLYLHPLRHVPGPKWAAASTSWAVYHTIWRQGELCYELERLHLKYGPVIRIEPNRLNFSSVSAYNTIYGQRISPQIFHKDGKLYQRLGDKDALGFYIDHRVARERREFLNPDFTRRRILAAQDMTAEHVNHLVERVLAESENGAKEVDMYRAFRSFTLDMISHIVLGKELGSLDSPGFGHELIKGMELVTLTIWYRFRSKWLCWWMDVVAGSVIKRFEMSLFGQVWFNRKCEEAYWRTVEGLKKGEVHDKVIIPRMVGAGWSKKSVVAECADLIFAGTDTVGNSLTIGFAHLLSDPEIQDRLLAEIKEIWPDLQQEQPTVEELEKLPYLQAVIKEFLRLSHGVLTPLFRVTSQETVVDGLKLPKGTFVGCANPTIHLDPTVYPNPHKFDPSRWLNRSPEELTRLNNSLIAFSRGPRNCMGMHLAGAELNLAISALVRRCNMKLVGFEMEHLRAKDYFTASYTSQYPH